MDNIILELDYAVSKVLNGGRDRDEFSTVIKDFLKFFSRALKSLSDKETACVPASTYNTIISLLPIFHEENIERELLEGASIETMEDLGEVIYIDIKKTKNARKRIAKISNKIDSTVESWNKTEIIPKSFLEELKVQITKKQKEYYDILEKRRTRDSKRSSK